MSISFSLEKFRKICAFSAIKSEKKQAFPNDVFTPIQKAQHEMDVGKAPDGAAYAFAFSNGKTKGAPLRSLG
ncbi:hypothetical protein BOO24_11090 [Vibrio navarrensis]|uniref:hypothetical protein n=1 Tax=Vibrio navarrensis TaxID=29495 RepID=UPI00186A0E61|nr:hypothetical protein [Vibrio navarrensis]MBE4592914.1 hypothetical protein [Vibrio navarrensis]